jgi:hypothetical protein
VENCISLQAIRGQRGVVLSDVRAASDMDSLDCKKGVICVLLRASYLVVSALLTSQLLVVFFRGRKGSLSCLWHRAGVQHSSKAGGIPPTTSLTNGIVPIALGE